MTEARWGSVAAALPDGKVLIISVYNCTELTSAELFNPTTETFEKLSPEMAEALHERNYQNGGSA
jgi:hypothetical protein